MLTTLIGGTVSKTDMNGSNILIVFLIILLVLAIKVILVQWSYNKIFPLLLYNINGENNKNFEKITFFDSIVIVILFNSLFQ